MLVKVTLPTFPPAALRTNPPYPKAAASLLPHAIVAQAPSPSNPKGPRPDWPTAGPRVNVRIGALVLFWIPISVSSTPSYGWLSVPDATWVVIDPSALNVTRN